MGGYNFNKKQCSKALLKLGFILVKTRRGKHDKFVPLKYLQDKIKPPQPLFIMIPRHKNLKCQKAILKELRLIGREELVRNFKKIL